MTSWSYEDAGSPSDPLQIRSIEITPDPLLTGRELKAVIKASVLGQVKDGAYLDIVVKVGLIKLLTKRYDLFRKLRGEDTDGWTLTASRSAGNSIDPGDTELVFTMTVPRETPPAKFGIEVRGFTADDDDLLYLKFRTSFQTS
ncbi:ML domain-containing protein [Kitasatospora sp. McL0602]|uniref:ML domain-containing protein n=1 Tax=Kitasatospora sp. McL0602 TaxID=3439530 RepID=UPI003F8864D3